ncbi:DUF916 and DUF3324 domain-containing protein [Enterococcus sp. LJL120]
MIKDTCKVLFKMILAISFLFGASLIWSNEVLATSDSSESSGGSFTYVIQEPENQINADSGYFNLMMAPSQQQTLIVTLSNPGEKKVTVNMALNGAKTNRNGVIEYANSEIENDASLPFSFTDLVTGPTSVELAPGETKDVELNVQMPETTFEGLILGGLQMILAEDESKGTTGQGAVVKNRYAYVVAIALQEGDVSGILPEMSWNNAYAGQANYRNSIFVNFSNIKGKMVTGMTVQAQISEQGSGEVLYESRSTSLQMAPYSFIEYPISMGGDSMTAGMYTAHVLVYVGDQSWEFTEDFEITVEDANQYNERDVGLTQERGLDWKLIAMIVVSFVLAVIVIFLVIRQIKKNSHRNINVVTKKKRPKKTKNKPR